jgi:hypothetical protein
MRYRKLELHVQHLIWREIQGDSFGGGHELIIINHAIIYQLKRNLGSAYHGKCGEKWVREDVKFYFPSVWGHRPGHDALCF